MDEDLRTLDPETDPNESETDAAPEANDGEKPRRSRKLFLLAGAVLLAVGVAGTVWLVESPTEKTRTVSAPKQAPDDEEQRYRNLDEKLAAGRPPQPVAGGPSSETVAANVGTPPLNQMNQAGSPGDIYPVPSADPSVGQSPEGIPKPNPSRDSEQLDTGHPPAPAVPVSFPVPQQGPFPSRPNPNPDTAQRLERELREGSVVVVGSGRSESPAATPGVFVPPGTKARAVIEQRKVVGTPDATITARLADAVVLSDGSSAPPGTEITGRVLGELDGRIYVDFDSLLVGGRIVPCSAAAMDGRDEAEGLIAKRDRDWGPVWKKVASQGMQAGMRLIPFVGGNLANSLAGSVSGNAGWGYDVGNAGYDWSVGARNGRKPNPAHSTGGKVTLRFRELPKPVPTPTPAPRASRAATVYEQPLGTPPRFPDPNSTNPYPAQPGGPNVWNVTGPAWPQQPAQPFQAFQPMQPGQPSQPAQPAWRRTP